MGGRPRRHRPGLEGGALLKPKPAGGLSVQTLLVSSLAAVVATIVVSQFWEQGTLLFTAMVPVVVAVTSELLRRPAERITAAAPKVAPRVASRRASGGTEVRERDDPFGLREPEQRPLLDDRRVRLGLVTGLVAFVLGAAFVTLSELTLGGSVGGGERRTTLLGGSSASSTEDEVEATPSSTPTPAAPGATATPTPPTTPEPEATPSPAPSATPPATPTPTPAAPQPSPTP